jgi:polyisoprenoid-binding protein YceI
MKTISSTKKIAGVLALLLILTSVVAIAQPVQFTIDTQRSTLSYTGDHRMHGWTGVSNAVNGTLLIDLEQPASSRIEIVVPVESFDSGNSNRDSNMLDTVESDKYPDVQFVSEEIVVDQWDKTTDGYSGTWRVKGQLTFHGQTQPVEIPVIVKGGNGSFEATGEFNISLKAFGVRRPKLLLMPISDEILLAGEIYASSQEYSNPQ